GDLDETGHLTVPADCQVPVESERPAGREVEGCDMESLRTVRCLSNPSGLQAARWRDATWSPCGLSGACRIRAACRPRGGGRRHGGPADCQVPVESERPAGREVACCSRRTLRITFPVVVMGRLSTNSITRGYSCAATLRRM